mmetsp:Transcript_10191/g.16725  ORF Transcript_10191/g.16725 Transcript_10191/m.16725 type:complete len:203 (-) Transcript_10191:1609-2217(-)
MPPPQCACACASSTPPPIVFFFLQQFKYYYYHFFVAAAVAAVVFAGIQPQRITFFTSYPSSSALNRALRSTAISYARLPSGVLACAAAACISTDDCAASQGDEPAAAEVEAEEVISALSLVTSCVGDSIPSPDITSLESSSSPCDCSFLLPETLIEVAEGSLLKVGGINCSSAPYASMTDTEPPPLLGGINSVGSLRIIIQR